MQQFFEFIDRKQREAKKHLKLIERLLRKGGMSVYSHLEDEEPYIFVKAPNKKLSFDGVRIYEIGEMIAYRIQKEEQTHPYGTAYMLDVEDMFNDFMSENMKEEEAGHKVIKSVVEELQKFFSKSGQAEQELNSSDQDRSGLIIKAGGTDYSSQVMSKM